MFWYLELEVPICLLLKDRTLQLKISGYFLCTFFFYQSEEGNCVSNLHLSNLPKSFKKEKKNVAACLIGIYEYYKYILFLYWMLRQWGFSCDVIPWSRLCESTCGLVEQCRLEITRP